MLGSHHLALAMGDSTSYVERLPLHIETEVVLAGPVVTIYHRQPPESDSQTSAQDVPKTLLPPELYRRSSSTSSL